MSYGSTACAQGAQPAAFPANDDLTSRPNVGVRLGAECVGIGTCSSPAVKKHSILHRCECALSACNLQTQCEVCHL